MRVAYITLAVSESESLSCIWNACSGSMQALESTGPCVQGIRDISLHNYLEFSAVTAALTLHQGRLCSIPACRADVHAASWLSAEGKRNLNLFLSAAQQAAAGSGSEVFQSSCFKAAMDDFGLPESVQVCLAHPWHTPNVLPVPNCQQQRLLTLR
jgi:hypothetical protein